MTRKINSSDRRAGKRRNRNVTLGTRRPRLGYYLIVTDAAETERNYFTGLRDSIPDHAKNHIAVRVKKSKTTEDLIQRTLELSQEQIQYCKSWIVLDRDEVRDFDSLISDAEANNIQVGWSNPCFEIWLYAYFGAMPVFADSQKCCSGFAEEFEKRSNNKYNKNDKDIYKKVNEQGDCEAAFRIAKQKIRICLEEGISPSQSNPATTVHYLVEEILGKVNAEYE